MTVQVPANARSRRTRSDLARATHDELARLGILKADAIAAAAGVSTATFYAHFATHDHATAAAFDISLTAVVDVAKRRFHIEALVEDGLAVVLERLVTEMRRVVQAENLVMRAAMARLSANEHTREVYRGHEATILAHLTHQVDLGQRAGLLRTGPAERRAISLLVLLQGLNNPLLVDKHIDPVIASDLHRSMLALLSPD